MEPSEPAETGTPSNVDETEREQRLRRAIAAARQGLYEIDVLTGRRTVSAEYASMLGYEHGSFVETDESWLERIHPDDRERVVSLYEAVKAGDLLESRIEYRQRSFEGDWRWILSLGRAVEFDESGRPSLLMGTYTDISEYKALQEELERREYERRMWFIESSVVMLMLDPEDGSIIEANDAALAFYGYSREQMQSMSIDEINVLPAHEIKRRMDSCSKEFGGRFEFPHRLSDSSVRIVEVSTSVVTWEGRKVLHSIIHDISRRKDLEHELELRATFDELTGIQNRRYFLEVAQVEMDRAQREGRRLTLAVIDLDRLKQVNDAYGHAVGDQMLRRLTKVFKSSLRSHDVFCRFGGDEFVLMMAGAGCAEMISVLQRIKRECATQPLVVDGDRIELSFSAGAAKFEACDTLDTLLARADHALYAVKESNRNDARCEDELPAE